MERSGWPALAPRPRGLMLWQVKCPMSSGTRNRELVGPSAGPPGTNTMAGPWPATRPTIWVPSAEMARWIWSSFTVFSFRRRPTRVPRQPAVPHR